MDQVCTKELMKFELSIGHEGLKDSEHCNMVRGISLNVVKSFQQHNDHPQRLPSLSVAT